MFWLLPLFFEQAVCDDANNLVGIVMPKKSALMRWLEMMALDPALLSPIQDKIKQTHQSQNHNSE